jgi:hypothetical protein
LGGIAAGFSPSGVCQGLFAASNLLGCRHFGRTREEFFDLPLQILIRGEADGILQSTFFQGLVDPWLRKRRIARNATTFPFRCWRSISGRSNSSQHPALCTLPGLWALSDWHGLRTCSG